MDCTQLIEAATKVLKPLKVKDRLCGDAGAAVLSEGGDVFVGVSVDTPSWGLCAERSAIAAMITAGQYKIAKVVAVWKDELTDALHILLPCGICREFMRAIDESNLDAAIVLGREQCVPLHQLLPFHAWPAALAETDDHHG